MGTESSPKGTRRILVCICGMAGSGKSTLCKKLAEKYGLKHYSGGDALKGIALEKGYRKIKRGWWESDEGMRFLKERGSVPALDEAVDEMLLGLAKKGNAIFDSWTMPWLLKKGFKIWLEASEKKRVERISKRDAISVSEALTALNEKERQTKEIYAKLYGFMLGQDFAPFHLILDTENLAADDVFHVLCLVMDNVVLNEVCACEWCIKA